MSASRPPEPPAPPTPRNGKIVTFYSYKGGTGRSMAVAHVAWILADSGRRVLVIDWDLEAPGLHRYFHPFLDDKHLADTPGLIDFLSAFVEGSRVERGGTDDPDWFERYTDFFPYALSLRGYEFRGGGGLDLLPAGRQDGGYAVKVTRFDWEAFYEKLGGGVFLQAFKAVLRAHYDYVLIDSRTGISDTSGICTVQMPDEMVLCFTYNSQSILGAEAAARSVRAQRLRPSGMPGLRIWPVPTRVETTGQPARLNAARALARDTFRPLLTGCRTVREREAYWNRIEVPYAPYLAFEEVLAPFVDSSRSKLTVLDSLSALTAELTDGRVADAPRIDEAVRLRVLKQYERAAAGPTPERDRGGVYLSYAIEDGHAATKIGTLLNEQLGEGTVVWDGQLLKPGDDWAEVLAAAGRRAQIVLALVTPVWLKKAARSHAKQEVTHALAAGKRVVPVLLGTDFGSLGGLRGPLKELSRRQAYLVWNLVSDRVAPEQVALLASSLKQLVHETPDPSRGVVDPDDPQRGRWGGRPAVNGRELRATVTPTGDDGWFDIRLEVAAVDGTPLTGSVVFHLHDTFAPDVRAVKPDGSRAVLRLQGTGAFTVGASADRDKTHLELDLAQLSDAPQAFREN